MCSRCFYKKNPSYKNYGERGITVCDLWLNGNNEKSGRQLFVEWAEKNGYQLGLTIDRIDVNGNYCPENCRWVTMSFQDNNKRNCHYLTARGKTQTVAQWAKELGVGTHCITDRLKKGWSVEEALFTPRAYFGVKRELRDSIMNDIEKEYYKS